MQLACISLRNLFRSPNTKFDFQNLGDLSTGVTWVRLTSSSKNDLTGKPIIAKDNLQFDDEFNKEMNCDAAYIMKGEYKFSKDNVAMIPLYIVNRKK